MVQLVLMIVRSVGTGGWGIRPAAYAVLALGAIYGAVHWSVRAMELNRQAAQPAQPAAPMPPPDFSTLGDGSQQMKNLDKLR